MFDQITENIYVGSWQDAMARSPDLLKKEGITAVLNVALDLMNPRVEYHKDFVMCHIPLTDGGGNTVAMCDLAVQALDTLLRANHKVLVHCISGKSRSVGTTATWLVQTGLHNSIDAAEADIKSKRERAEIQPDLKALFQQVLDK
jgi:protein-tyrosine phosphatase